MNNTDSKPMGGKAKPDDSEVVRGVRRYQLGLGMFNLIIPLDFIMIIIGLPVGFLFVVAGGDAGYLPLLIIGIAAIPVEFILAKLNKKLEKKFKIYVGENITRDIIAERVEISQYSPDKWINSGFIDRCMILPKYDRMNGSDYVKGTYRGVPFVYCDLELEREYQDRDKDGHKKTKYRTVFKGSLINLEMPKEMEGYLRIKERKEPRKEKNFLSNIFSGAADVIGISKTDNTIEVESVEFNNRFEIKSNNGEMAFYILTPQFMESILRAEKMTSGYTNIEFKGRNANITINNGSDSFEIKRTMCSRRALEKSRQQMRKELNLILDIVDEMLTKDKLF